MQELNIDLTTGFAVADGCSLFTGERGAFVMPRWPLLPPCSLYYRLGSLFAL